MKMPKCAADQLVKPIRAEPPQESHTHDILLRALAIHKDEDLSIQMVISSMKFTILVPLGNLPLIDLLRVPKPLVGLRYVDFCVPNHFFALFVLLSPCVALVLDNNRDVSFALEKIPLNNWINS